MFLLRCLSRFLLRTRLRIRLRLLRINVEQPMPRFDICSSVLFLICSSFTRLLLVAVAPKLEVYGLLLFGLMWLYLFLRLYPSLFQSRKRSIWIGKVALKFPWQLILCNLICIRFIVLTKRNYFPFQIKVYLFH